MSNPLDLAIKTEKDGIAFYKKEAEKSGDEMGRKMFLSFVEDEKRHLEILQKMSCKEHVCISDIENYSPKKNLKTIFSEMKEEERKGSIDTSTDIGALELAMEMERMGYDQYMEAAKMEKDEEHKRIYMKLAQEEKEHFDLLQEARSYLEDTGNWYMWYEHKFPT
ncbi:MAG TPA: ferritin family protein [Candidatus Methanofastidiosa archaeon]|nr:ferritin family protein [Candidatus Methanofastidiosa archaeon]HPR41242.1 ferritin family protein [Candidatus Methanofastidiosa archaeon]